MEVTALRIKLMLLLVVVEVDYSHSQNVVVAFPQVIPNRQQLFQYESITVSCEGLKELTGWRVIKKVDGDVKTCAATWSESTGPCNIENAFPKVDSGEYWCEMGGRKRSNTVNITVTAGSVILESPVHPVMEGDTVTLGCKMKDSSSNLTAEFFKDGRLMERSSTGNLTIPRVFTFYQGLYKCRISGTEESPGSWLIVKVPQSQKQDPAPSSSPEPTSPEWAVSEAEPGVSSDEGIAPVSMEGTAHEETQLSTQPPPHPSSHQAPQHSLLLCVGLGVLALLLLLLLGSLPCASDSSSSLQFSPSTHTVVIYSVTAEPRKEKGY